MWLVVGEWLWLLDHDVDDEKLFFASDTDFDFAFSSSPARPAAAHEHSPAETREAELERPDTQRRESSAHPPARRGADTAPHGGALRSPLSALSLSAHPTCTIRI